MPGHGKGGPSSIAPRVAIEEVELEGDELEHVEWVDWMQFCWRGQGDRWFREMDPAIELEDPIQPGTPHDAACPCALCVEPFPHDALCPCALCVELREMEPEAQPDTPPEACTCARCMPACSVEGSSVEGS